MCDCMDNITIILFKMMKKPKKKKNHPGATYTLMYNLHMRVCGYFSINGFWGIWFSNFLCMRIFKIFLKI